eukprot:jgi/Ulvmu1/10944/UM007_0123.1
MKRIPGQHFVGAQASVQHKKVVVCHVSAFVSMRSVSRSSACTIAMADNSAVQVAVRVRDLLPRERLSGYVSCINVQQDRVVVGSKRGFCFDFAFSPTCSQESVYDTAVKPLLETCQHGVNITIAAYGQTGSGKTYTMGTAGIASQAKAQQGIAPRLASDIFAQAADGCSLAVVVSCLEIYGEELHDLLADNSRSKLKIREHAGGQIAVAGLREVTVSNEQDLLDVLGKGLLKRATGSTHMNEESSRSHAICTITLTGHSAPDGRGSSTFTSKIQLVDLAGSERLSQTFARTTKETCQINKGLHALSNVIMALSPLPATAAAPHVPYRDSKLTRVLQDALGGSARTVLIACVSAADESINETLSTLQYATRARRIQNRPVETAGADEEAGLQLSALQRMQWTLLRQHLAAVGLMPLPDILMKDLHDMTDAEARVHLLQAANGLVAPPAAPTTPAHAPLSTPTTPSEPLRRSSGNCMDGPVDPESTSPLLVRLVNGDACSGCQQPLPQAAAHLASTATPAPQSAASNTGNGCPPGGQSAHVQDCTGMMQDLQTLLRLDAVQAPHAAGALRHSGSGDIAAKYLLRSGNDCRGGAEGRQGSGNGWAADDAAAAAAPEGMSGRAHAAGQGIFVSPLQWSLPWAAAGGRPQEGPQPAAGSGHGGCGASRSGSSDREDEFESCDRLAEVERDMVVFDEDAASYVSATDYRSMLHSLAPELGAEADALHSSHARLQAEGEGTESAHSGAVAMLRAQIEDLEAAMAAQEGELHALRCEEGRARHACAVLQHTCCDLHAQIEQKEEQLARAHSGLKALEQSLDRSEAEKEAARADGEARIAAIAARKADLERQLRGASVATAAARAQGAAARVAALEARLQDTRTTKASAEARLQECRAAHQEEKRKLQRDRADLQRRLRDTEKRAVALLRDKSRHEQALARKDRQLEDSQHALHALKTAVGASPRRQEMSQQTLQWWDRQIALLAERACAGGRVTELERQSAALQQQRQALHTAPAELDDGEEAGAARQEEDEQLALQQHVTEGSLAVGREQLSSAAMIKATLQTAAARLALPQARHLLLHLVSALLATLVREHDSRLRVHTLRSSLSLVTQLNHHLQRSRDRPATDDGSAGAVGDAASLRLEGIPPDSPLRAAAVWRPASPAPRARSADTLPPAARGSTAPAAGGGLSDSIPRGNGIGRGGRADARLMYSPAHARLLSPGAAPRSAGQHADHSSGVTVAEKTEGHLTQRGSMHGSPAAPRTAAAAAGVRATPARVSRASSSGADATACPGSGSAAAAASGPAVGDGQALTSPMGRAARAGCARTARPGSARRTPQHSGERSAAGSCAHALILQASIDAEARREDGGGHPGTSAAGAGHTDMPADLPTCMDGRAYRGSNANGGRGTDSAATRLRSPRSSHGGESPDILGGNLESNAGTQREGATRVGTNSGTHSGAGGMGGIGGDEGPLWGQWTPDHQVGMHANDGECGSGGAGTAAWSPQLESGLGRGHAARMCRMRLDFDQGVQGDAWSQHAGRYGHCGSDAGDRTRPGGAAFNSRTGSGDTFWMHERRGGVAACAPVTAGGVSRSSGPVGGTGRHAGADRRMYAPTQEPAFDSASSMPASTRPHSGRKRVQFADVDQVASFPVDDVV